MKQTLTAFLLCSFFVAFSQHQPPGLIYSCVKKVNGNSQYDIFNSSGNKFIQQPVDWAYSNTWSWLFIVDNKAKLIKCYSYDGRDLGIDSIESSQSTYINLNRIGLKRTGKWGFYDKQGKLKIPHLYDEISHFRDDKAAVKLGGEMFLIDTNGVRLVAKYDPADKNYVFEDMDIAIGMGGDFYSRDFKKISENGKTGLLDVVNNKIIVPVEYDKLVDLNEKFKLITGCRNGKCGLIAFGGKIIIPVVYESVFVLNNYF